MLAYRIISKSYIIATCYEKRFKSKSIVEAKYNVNEEFYFEEI